MKRVFRTSSGSGRHRVDVTLSLVGNDLVAVIAGGEKPHVGAVAVAVPRPSLRDPSRLSSTSSVFTMVGHKDDEVARQASETLATELKRVAVVSAGLHVDQASEEDVRRLARNAKKAVEKAIGILKGFEG